MQFDPSTLTASIQDPRDLDTATEAAWVATLLEQPEQTPFLGPTFAKAVAAHAGRSRVCVIEAAGKPIGFFPFQYRSSWRRILGAAERIGGALADFSGLVGPADLRLTPLQLLRLARLNAFTVSHLASSQQRFGLGGETPRIGLRIDLPDGAEAYWKERTRAELSRVRDTERCRRKLEHDVGGVRFELQATDGPEQLDRLIAMKRAQYARTASDDPLSSAGTQAVLHSLLASRNEDCEGLLSTIYAGETWVASHFGARCGAAFHYWFPVYNPALSKYSPGRLLLLEIIRATAERGVRTVDMGEGDSPSKRFFATGEYKLFRGRWTRPGLRTLVSQFEDSLRWRLMQRQPSASATGPTARKGQPDIQGT